MLTKKKKILMATISVAAMISTTSAFAASTFENTLMTGIENSKTSIDVSSYNLTSAAALNQALNSIQTSPDAWAVSDKISIQSSGGKAKAVVLEYDYTEKEIAAMQEYIDRNVKKAAAIANTFQDDYSKVKAVYDYLINTYEYDWTLTKSKEYELFKTGSGVCTAYSLAFKDIMQELNIPCYVVVSKEIAHMWNVVQINGKWYNIDSSWGDIYAKESESFRYDNFLKSDNYFELLGHIGGIAENNISCTDETFDYKI